MTRQLAPDQENFLDAFYTKKWRNHDHDESLVAILLNLARRITALEGDTSLAIERDEKFTRTPKRASGSSKIMPAEPPPPSPAVGERLQEVDTPRGEGFTGRRPRSQ